MLCSPTWKTRVALMTAGGKGLAPAAAEVGMKTFSSPHGSPVRVDNREIC